MKLSIVIPVLNGGQSFKLCLESIQSGNRRPDELIIVIDGHDPDSATLAQTYTHQVIINSQTRGPAFARNVGVQHATGDFIVFFDADVTVHNDTLQRIEDYFEQHPVVDALMGSYDDAPADPLFLSQYKNLMHHYVHQTSNRQASTFWGACGAIRRDIFLDFGGFDESYTRPCIEDIELGYRLSAQGHLIHLVPEIQIKHHKQWTPRKLIESDIRDRAIPWSHLILTQNQLVNDLNIDSRSRISTIVIYLLILTLLIAFLMPPLFGLVIIWGCILVWLNRDIYKFLYRHRGVFFLIQSLFWHWLYYLYSGLTFLGVWSHIHLQTFTAEQN
jgi:glycosyltransferase involved in cell wall biosynthesis